MYVRNLDNQILLLMVIAILVLSVKLDITLAA